MSGKWNVLTVICKNIDTTRTENGVVKEFKASMTDNCVGKIQKDIKQVDTIVVDEPLTDFTQVTSGGLTLAKTYKKIGSKMVYGATSKIVKVKINSIISKAKGQSAWTVLLLYYISIAFLYCLYYYK